MASASPWAAARLNHLKDLGQVLFDANATGIEDAEVELAVGDAAIGGFGGNQIDALL